VFSQVPQQVHQLLAETKTQMPIVQRENKSPEFLMNELLDQF
jgi:hypothetical protein